MAVILARACVVDSEWFVFGCRFAEMNRQLLEIYGTRASKLMPDFWPDYDPRYSSLTLDSVKALIAHANDAAGSG